MRKGTQQESQPKPLGKVNEKDTDKLSSTLPGGAVVSPICTQWGSVRGSTVETKKSQHHLVVILPLLLPPHYQVEAPKEPIVLLQAKPW